ncbi:MAG: DNA glycosylase, partial [Oscillospiraceae bacterium]|nr:DNA glycosylase [Oscillospiraceae bacterium]
MRIETAGNEIKITPEDDFSAKKIFDCGQCFRWNENPDGSYTGVALGRAARVREDRGSVYITGTIEDFETVWSDYFDFGSNYAERRKLCAVDDYMLAASEYGRGIRILNQDRWEALCSFIISQCNNIPRIKKIVETMSSLWGEGTELEGREYRAFPDAERVAALSERELEPLRSGYRAPYILNAARMVSEGRLDLEALSKLEYAEAKRRLMELPGIGEKVANCVVLFSLRMPSAFP